jgi:hypothetical protein
VSKRTENHGDTLVHAKDLFWKLDGPNTLLDLINPGLRHAIYKHAGTQPIPGVEETTPELRTSMLEGPFSMKYEGTGYMLTVMYGEVTEDKIELHGCVLAKFKVDPKEGGTVSLIFRSSHTGLDMEAMGRLDTFDGKELQILLAPPTLQDGTLPDKKAKKAKGDKVDTQTAALPFKYSVPKGGGIVDNTPTDPKGDATEQFLQQAAKEDAAVKGAAADPKAKRFPVAAKQAAAKKKPATRR